MCVLCIVNFLIFLIAEHLLGCSESACAQGQNPEILFGGARDSSASAHSSSGRCLSQCPSVCTPTYLSLPQRWVPSVLAGFSRETEPIGGA